MDTERPGTPVPPVEVPELMDTGEFRTWIRFGGSLKGRDWSEITSASSLFGARGADELYAEAFGWDFQGSSLRNNLHVK